MTAQKILTFLRSHQDDMTQLLTRLVEIESPSDHKPSLDKLSAFLANELQEMGAVVETLPQVQAGNHVRARWGAGEKSALILCHMDTVWDLGTLAGRPVRIEDGKLYGAGAEDMKGGIVIAIWAIRALRELGLFPAKTVTLLLNSDEEIGSDTSRPTIEAEAQSHRAVFVLEPAEPPYAYKTARKGVGEFHIKVRGLATHSGADHKRGINAIEELARQVLTIQGFTNYEVGTTVNVGVISGGTRSNVVPAEARAEVDARVLVAEEIATLEAKMKGLKAHHPGAVLEVSGGFDRPPMVRTPRIAALYARAKEIADGLDLKLAEACSGGASDGNFTAALGIPTLDGMGVVGDGGHALDEHVVLSSLPERATLLAEMIRSL